MEHAIVISIAVSVFVLLIALLARNKSKTRRKTRLGSPTGQGKNLLFSSYQTHDSTISSAEPHIPKDTQDYAKAMMPKSKGNAK
jgi:hypothetical protein